MTRILTPSLLALYAFECYCARRYDSLPASVLCLLTLPVLFVRIDRAVTRWRRG